MDRRIRVTIIVAITIAVALFYLTNSALNTSIVGRPNFYGSEPGNVIMTLKTPVDLEKAKALTKAIKADYIVYSLKTYNYHYDDDGSLAVIGLDTSDKDVEDLYKLADGRLPVTKDEVAVSAKVPEQLNKKIGDSFVVPSKNGRGFEKRIVGLIDDRNLGEFDKRFAVLPLTGAQKDYGYSSKINQINLQVPTEDVDLIVATLNKNFASYGGFASGLYPQVKNSSHTQSNQKSINMSTILYGSLALFAAFVLINAVFTSNIQRTKRVYATYRILGATRKYLRKLIMIEGLKVGVIGSLIGVVSGHLMLIGLDAIGKAFLARTPFTVGFSFSLPIAVLSIALGTLVTFFAFFRGFRILVRIKPIEIYRMSNNDQDRDIGWLRVVSCFALLILGLAGLSYYAIDPAAEIKALFGGLGFIFSLFALMQLTTILLSLTLSLTQRFLIVPLKFCKKA